jgi:hypothetical protein
MTQLDHILPFVDSPARLVFAMMAVVLVWYIADRFRR